MSTSAPTSPASSPTAVVTPSWPRGALAVVACCVVVLVSMSIQLPGLLTGDAVLAEPDVTTIELAQRRHWWQTPGGAAGLHPLGHLGAPVWALPAAGVAFPTTWLFAPLPGELAVGVAWLVQGCVFAVGWLWALRRLGLGWPASLCPAWLFVVSGPMWSFHAVGTMDLASVAGTGWLVGAAHAWCRAPTAGHASLVGILLATIFVAGDPLMVPLAALVAVVVAWPHRPPPARAWQRAWSRPASARWGC